jgi:hypothetical protein
MTANSPDRLCPRSSSHFHFASTMSELPNDFSKDLSTFVYARPSGQADLYLLKCEADGAGPVMG